MSPARVYADFQNADSQGRIRLNCAGTVEDISRLGITLREGLVLTLYADDADAEGNADDLEVMGTVQYSTGERIWVAIIDWSAIGHASDVSRGGGDGTNRNAADAEVPPKAIRHRR